MSQKNSQLSQLSIMIILNKELKNWKRNTKFISSLCERLNLKTLHSINSSIHQSSFERKKNERKKIKKIVSRHVCFLFCLFWNGRYFFKKDFFFFFKRSTSKPINHQLSTTITFISKHLFLNTFIFGLYLWTWNCFYCFLFRCFFLI